MLEMKNENSILNTESEVISLLPDNRDLESLVLTFKISRYVGQSIQQNG